MDKPYTVTPAKRITLLIIGFFAISGAWLLSSQHSQRDADTAHSSAVPLLTDASSKGSTAITQSIPANSNTTANKRQADASKPVFITDTPLQNGPAPLSWREGQTVYRAVHYITQWNTSSHAWQELSPDLTEDTEVGTPGYGLDGITALAHQGDSWYVGTLAGQLTVKEQSHNWTIIQGALPLRTITAIALPPGSQTENEAVVGYGGYSTATPSSPGHVFLTGDGGKHWANITGNLPDKPVQSIHIVQQFSKDTIVVEVDDKWYQMTRSSVWVPRTVVSTAHIKLLDLLQSLF